MRLAHAPACGVGRGADTIPRSEPGQDLPPENPPVAAELVSQPAEGQFQEGNHLRGRGDWQGAVACYEAALCLRPDHADTHANLGVALAEVGRLDEAIACWRRALGLQPRCSAALVNLGVALTRQGRPDEARACLEEALRVDPQDADAAYNLGVLHMEQRRREEAIASLERTLSLRPDHAEACNNLGLVLNEAGRAAEAAVMLGQAARLRPGFVEAHNNLGTALVCLGRPDQAEASYREALRLDPSCAEAHANLGRLCTDLGRYEEGLAHFQLALRIKPDPQVRWHRSLSLLAGGEFEKGWAEYESRWQFKEFPSRGFSPPLWDGSSLRGRSILLHAEQGLGDTLHFIRYAALLKEQGTTVLVECPACLIPLLSRCAGIDHLIGQGAELPEFDVHAPLLSLPHLCGTTLATVPAQVPYLFADPEAVEHWRHRLEGVHELKIGVVWQGNPAYANDRLRSIPLAGFAPLARQPGVRLYSLQKGTGAEQVAAVAERFEVTELVSELDAQGGAFTETSAIIENLDLVISPDTAIAHLAGGLGALTWVALMAQPDWRWLRGRDDSPWYPSMRLFRQSVPGDWGPVFERMAAEVQKLLVSTRS